MDDALEMDRTDTLDRRGFLKGLIGGVTAAGVVVAASQTEIAAFGSALAKDAPIVLTPSPAEGSLVGHHLYNKRGEIVAIITDVFISGHERAAPEQGHQVVIPDAPTMK